MTRSLSDIIPDPAARAFVGIICRENRDPNVGAWFACECTCGGMFVRVERIAEVAPAPMRKLLARAGESRSGTREEQRLW